MSELARTILVLAAEAPPAQTPKQPDWLVWIFPVFMILLLFMWLQSRSQQKKQKSEREEMLKSLKPKDKIETIGGLFGTVTQVREDDLSIRVDDARDVTVRIARSAVRRRVGDKAKTDEN